MAKKTKKSVNKTSAKSQDDTRLFAFLATFLSIIGFIIILIKNEKSEYVKFYAKQSLIVFIASVIAGILGLLVVWIPVLGTAIKVALNIIIVILWIISWIYALSGEKKEVPYIGQYARSINW